MRCLSRLISSLLKVPPPTCNELSCSRNSLFCIRKSYSSLNLRELCIDEGEYCCWLWIYIAGLMVLLSLLETLVSGLGERMGMDEGKSRKFSEIKNASAIYSVLIIKNNFCFV
jgi:hypothetical protein